MFSRNDSPDSDPCIRGEKAQLWAEAVPKEGTGPLLHEISMGIYLPNQKKLNQRILRIFLISGWRLRERE